MAPQKCSQSQPKVTPDIENSLLDEQAKFEKPALLKKNQSAVGRVQTLALGSARNRKSQAQPCPQGAPRLVDPQMHEQICAIKCGGAHLFYKVLWDHRGSN